MAFIGSVGRYKSHIQSLKLPSGINSKVVVVMVSNYPRKVCVNSDLIHLALVIPKHSIGFNTGK